MRLCGMAHKYEATELERAAKLAGTSPMIPELLLLGQQVKNPAILEAILAKEMRSLCALAPGPRVATVTCPIHPYGCTTPPRTERDVLDAAGRALLLKLKPSTLVKLIEAFVAAFGKRPKPKPKQLPMY